MESTFAKLIVQVPDLVALIIIVLLFLKAQERRDSLLSELHKEHIESRKESRQVIDACTKMMGQVMEDMREFAAVVRQCNKR